MVYAPLKHGCKNPVTVLRLVMKDACPQFNLDIVLKWDLPI